MSYDLRERAQDGKIAISLVRINTGARSRFLNKTYILKLIIFEIFPRENPAKSSLPSNQTICLTYHDI